MQELLLYLLQLVQALKFESSTTTSSVRAGRTTHRKRAPSVSDSEDSGLAQFLIDRSVANAVLGNALHWYLMIEADPRMFAGKMYAKVAFRFMKKLAEVRHKTMLS